MANLVAVTIKERNSVVFDTPLTAAIPGAGFLSVKEIVANTDTEVKVINRTSPRPDIYLLDESFAALLPLINAVNTTTSVRVVDLNVIAVDDKTFATENRMLAIDNMVYCEDDPDNSGTNTLIYIWDPQKARITKWTAVIAIATLITNANA